MNKNIVLGLIYLLLTIICLFFSLFALFEYIRDTTKHYILILGCISSLTTIKLGLNTFGYYYDYFNRRVPLLTTEYV